MSGWLGDIINEWFRRQTKAGATDKLLAVGLPVGPVQNAKEIFDCPHVAARKLIIDVPDPILGSVKLVGPPARLSDTAVVPPKPAPLLGQHNEEILTELLGYTKDQVQELKRETII
jgi:formyl-CoA transferase